jgi:predicted Ser/Thr protein kinase/tetratricopeptide (TPR) repeat protein
MPADAPGPPARPAPAPAPCLSETQVDRLASGEASPEAFEDHLRACPSCAARLDSARKDALFLTRARALSAPLLGPAEAPRIPGYRAERVISSGAQGIVYRAVQESTSRPVAIKVLLAGEGASPRQRARAEREAEIAARLRHPGIVTVYESRVLADGRVALVMEFIDGVPIDRWSPPGQTPDARRRALLRAFADACTAVHHAHLNAVIHRDLKPDNILVTPQGRPVVLDFGVARAGGIQTTRTGDFAGTPAYASPEQISGRTDMVDALTDVYALGVTLYKVLTGAFPYDLQGSLFEISRQIDESSPRPPRSRDASIHPDLEAIALRAIRKEKESRYQSAISLARDIERFLAGEPVEALGASGWYVLRKAMARNRARLAAASVGAALIVGAGIVAIQSRASAAAAAERIAKERERSRAESVRARAVTELLREALPGVDPQRPDSHRIASAGFGRLYLRLETGAFAAEPDLDQALRRLWAEVYTGLASGKGLILVEYAEVSLRNGLMRLRTRHTGDHAEVAATMHELASVLTVRKRLFEAERYCRDALAMRERLFGVASVEAGTSHALLARVLHARGDAAQALGESQLILDAFADSDDPVMRLHVASMQALRGRILLDQRRPDDAHPLVLGALRARLATLPPEDPDLHASLSDAADCADALPTSDLARAIATAWPAPTSQPAPQDPPAPDSPRAAIALLALPDRGDATTPVLMGRTSAMEGLARLHRHLLGEHDPALIRVLTAQLRCAITEGLDEPRINAALAAADAIARALGPDDFAAVVCLEDASVALATAGRPRDAVAAAERAMRIRQSVPAHARDPLATGNSLRYIAWYHWLDGDAPNALRLARQVREALQHEVGPAHHVILIADLIGAAALADLNDLPAAEAQSRLAADQIFASRVTPIDTLAHARFLRGRVLLRTGKLREARESMLLGWDLLYKTWGVRTPWRRMLLDDLASIDASLNSAHTAAHWRAMLETPAAEVTPSPPLPQ